MRLGILTGGGDCPGLNAVIRAAVVRTVRTYEGHMLGFEDGWRGLLANRAIELDLKSIAGILPRGGTMLGTSRVDPLREPGGIAAVHDAFKLHALSGLLVCGGDGTLSAASRLSREGLPIIGIPKTIDNDIPGTDRAVGCDTAMATVTHAVDALHTTAESHNRVIVVEVMGRRCGWIAIGAGTAGGADVVVTPEVPVCMQEICDLVRHRVARGRRFSIVVVAEGARFKPDPDGSRVEVPVRNDEFGRPRFGGVGEVVARQIESRLQIETRTVTLGYVQRGGTPTAFDRLLGTRMGTHAVDLASRGEWGRMVSLRGASVGSVELSVVEAGPSQVDSELYEVARTFFG
jgi:phosphofructokinase-like protein